MPAGTVVPSASLITPGGPQGIPGPTTQISTDPGNIATWGSDSKLYVPSGRSVYNAFGNSTFEVDQYNVHAAQTGLTGGGTTRICDRWFLARGGAPTAAWTVQSIAGAEAALAAPNNPISNLSNSFIRITLTTAQATPAAGDQVLIRQFMEGPQLRELGNGPTSITLAFRPSSGVSSPITLPIGLRDGGATYSCVLPMTINPYPAITWVTLPNIPVFASGGNFNTLPGNVGAYCDITLLCGATGQTATTGLWVAGSYVSTSGMTNFAALPTGSYLDVFFGQWEPGPVCNAPADLDFLTNYDRCLRYLSKTFDYGLAPGGAMNYAGAPTFAVTAATTADSGYRFAKTMARVPTVTYYQPATGAINSAYDLSGAVTVTGISSTYVSQTGVLRISGTGFVANHFLAAHMVADTGW